MAKIVSSSTTLSEFKKKNNCKKLRVFPSQLTGSLYARDDAGNTIANVAKDFDPKGGAVVLNMTDTDTGNCWNFIYNGSKEEPLMVI
jgi:ribosome biogenesis protein Nip4